MILPAHRLLLSEGQVVSILDLIENMNHVHGYDIYSDHGETFELRDRLKALPDFYDPHQAESPESMTEAGKRAIEVGNILEIPS